VARFRHVLTSELTKIRPVRPMSLALLLTPAVCAALGPLRVQAGAPGPRGPGRIARRLLGKAPTQSLQNGCGLPAPPATGPRPPARAVRRR
jgi:hypothetical protein